MNNFVVSRALLAMFLVLAEYSAAQKLGVCPDFAGLKVKCVEECGDDSQCLGDERCCSNGCGHVCIAPTEVIVDIVLRGKPGLCPFMPRVHVLCLANAEIRCVSDRDCPCDQKCCDVHCGRSCVNPLIGVVKVGQCPPVSITNVSVALSEWDQCSNDVHCPQCRKCCFSRGGRQCTPPMPEIVKKGVCPFVDTSVIRCGRPIVNCLSDNDCPCNLKCCNMGCERRCIGPVSVPKAGACPAASPIAAQCLRFDQQCVSDDDCSDELKCCDVPCGTRCIESREAGTLNWVCNVWGASRKRDCDLSLACSVFVFKAMLLQAVTLLLVLGGAMLVQPVSAQLNDTSVRPGRCPVTAPTALLLLLPTRSCVNDSGCPPPKKCCNVSDALVCLRAVPEVTAEAGQCPQPPPHGNCATGCARDADCLGGRRCCLTTCGHECVAPAPVPKVRVNGTAPWPPYISTRNGTGHIVCLNRTLRFATFAVRLPLSGGKRSASVRDVDPSSTLPLMAGWGGACIGNLSSVTVAARKASPTSAAAGATAAEYGNVK
ncbi:unnamed protein product [Lampetra planeri]